jgi:hypothetical protein
MVFALFVKSTQHFLVLSNVCRKCMQVSYVVSKFIFWPRLEKVCLVCTRILVRGLGGLLPYQIIYLTKYKSEIVVVLLRTKIDATLQCFLKGIVSRDFGVLF